MSCTKKLYTIRFLCKEDYIDDNTNPPVVNLSLRVFANDIAGAMTLAWAAVTFSPNEYEIVCAETDGSVSGSATYMPYK